MSLEGPILLYGAGREGLSTRKFLAQHFPDISVDFTVDEGQPELENATFVSMDVAAQKLREGHYKTLVRSPGVSIYKPLIKQAIADELPVTTNVNLWGKYRKKNAKVIAITGTKGKSTTTKLIHTILTTAGFDAGLAGNIGVPLLDAEWHEYMVLELSSFQCSDLKIDVDFIGLTSLFPEHLDWHQGPANYFRDKLNLLRRKKPYKMAVTQQVKKHAVLPQPRQHLVNALPNLSEVFDEKLQIGVTNSALKGTHNLENARLAARLALAIGATEDQILQGVQNFEPLPHRLQPLTLGSKTFVNDSIATNPEATKAAVNAYPGQKTHLIIGGYDRDQNYDDLINFLTTVDVQAVWFLPDTGWRIAQKIATKPVNFKMHQPEKIEDIFAELAANPDDFDTLILSPGAPSYNQFANFEERGTRFLDLAKSHFS